MDDNDNPWNIHINIYYVLYDDVYTYNIQASKQIWLNPVLFFMLLFVPRSRLNSKSWISSLDKTRPNEVPISRWMWVKMEDDG